MAATPDNTPLIVAGIVAGTSIGTLLITNIFAFKSKRIDADQKINEHKMLIRTAYVNKKIDAGIDFVSKTTIRINIHYLVTVFYKYLIERKQFNKEYWEAVNSARGKQRQINLSNNNSPHLFFDTLNFHEEANELIHQMNSQQVILSEFMKSEGSVDYTPDIELAAKVSLELNEKIISVYQRMNIFVRNELAKYDIL